MLGLVALVAVGVGLWAYRTGASWNELVVVPEAIQQRPEVRLAKVTIERGRAADATVVATGYLESRRQAKIGARAPGRIEVVNVEEGIRVEAQQVLAVLEHADLDASLAAARATLQKARADLAEHEVLIEQSKRDHLRAERLFATGSITDAEYEEAKYRYESAVARRASLEAEVSLAEARVREAEQMLENMFIRAPFDGTVISKDAEVGESILPGGMGEASGRGSVVTVADLEHLEVDCDVKEDFISRIVPGQAAEVAVDAVPERRYEGRVRKIIPMGDRARATIKVKVEIVEPDDRLFPDMSATVHFLPEGSAASEPDAPPRVFCDSEAIQRDAQGTFVWVLDADNRLRRQDVTVGAERDRRLEVTSGLEGTERVVIAPPNAQAGLRVKAVP